MKLTGGQIICEYLIERGIPYAIGIPGHGCLGLVDALKERADKIEVIQVKQEMSAVHMADGYYRITGTPLMVFTSIGPGAVNTVIGVATAFVDSTAVLVLIGDVHTYMVGTGVLQEIERKHLSAIPHLFDPIVKKWWRVTRPSHLPITMRQAFLQMLSGRRGPVVIALPMDVQSESAEVDLPFPEVKITKELHGDKKEIEKAVELLLSAKRPVILAGGGVVTSEAFEELKELAEYLGAAVITTMMGKSSFPEDHPLYAWHAGSKGTSCGNYIASTADVLLAIGCRFADETTSSYRRGVSFNIPPTRLIHIDIDPAEIGKNYPCEVGIVGDAKTILQDMLVCLKELAKPKDYKNTDYYHDIQKAKEDWFRRLAKFQDENIKPMTISCLLKEVRRCLDRDAVVVTSSGNTQAQVLQEFPFYVPKTHITTGGFSTMGFTLPSAMGVKLALPDKQVVGIVGDGDFMMTMQELSTAVQFDLNVVIILVNNMGWISIKDLQMGVLGEERAYATDFLKDGKPYSPHFANIALDFGAYGERIERKEEIKPALTRAFASNRPAVIEVMVNRDYPYSGSPAVGWWDVPIPAYLEERRRKYEKEREEEFK